MGGLTAGALAFATLLLAGCTAPAREAYVIESTEPASSFPFTSAFGPEERAVVITFFNLTEDGWAEYRFRVGDAGTGRACFYAQEGLGASVAATYGQANATQVRAAEFGCTRAVAEAEAGTPLPRGAYAFALMTIACPHRDCSFGFSVQHDGVESGTVRLAVPASDR